jgi:hypothetical protein
VVTYVLFHKMLWSGRWRGPRTDALSTVRWPRPARPRYSDDRLPVHKVLLVADKGCRRTLSREGLLSESALPRKGRTTGTSPGRHASRGRGSPHGVSAPSPRVGAGCPA